MIDALRRELPDLKLSLNRPYRELTTLGVGGELPVLAEPVTEEELIRLLKFAHRRRLDFFILGGGSNLVGMDGVYSGIGIRLDKTGFGALRRDGDRVFCGAMAKLPALAAFAAREGLSGVTVLAGIPGSIGGALRMNASCRGTAIGEVVEEVRGVRFDGSPWSAEGRGLKWRYREGGVPENVVITSAVLRLRTGDATEELAALAAETARRRETEPSGRSAGCVFRNVSLDRPAGMLIDRCGLRGCRVGGAEVSSEHANYIINASGNASEADFLLLARLIRRTVRERFGCDLRPEVRFISAVSAAALASDRPPDAVAAASANRMLSGACRWLYRIAVFLAALTLAAASWGIRHTSIEACVVLAAGAVLLLLSEAVYAVLNRAERS